MEHSTRSGQAAFTTEQERRSTESWFANPASQVSASAVVDGTGFVTEFVCGCPDLNAWPHTSHGTPGQRTSLVQLEAWHAGYLNASYAGLEWTQSVLGGALTDRQYSGAAWWHVFRLQKQQPSVHLEPAYLPEHRQTDQGRAIGKSDIGDPWSRDRLLAAIGTLA